MTTGTFITSNQVTGEVVDRFFDGGDYENNVQEFITVENPLGEFVSIDPKNAKAIEWNEYLDLIGLVYGVFY